MERKLIPGDPPAEARIKIHAQRNQKLSVLMPVFNERWTLAEIIRRVFDVDIPIDLELIVVDDGSDDGSWELLTELAADEPRIRAFRHKKNKGKGAAIRTAIEQITGDFAVIQDADLEYDPRDYNWLLEPLLQDKADAVFGSRFTGNAHVFCCFGTACVTKH